jgi:tRNA(adenine34) deaminase
MNFGFSINNSKLSISYSNYLKHEFWMKKAIALAKVAGEKGDVPVGAVIVGLHNQLIAASSNQKEQNQDPTAHAEILVIQQASQHLNNWHLGQCTLYVTLEPCPMCTGAIIHSRLGLLVYGADDPKTGTIRTVFNLPDSACSNHRVPVISGICETECQQILKTWFQGKRRSLN